MIEGQRTLAEKATGTVLHNNYNLCVINSRTSETE